MTRPNYCGMEEDLTPTGGTRNGRWWFLVLKWYGPPAVLIGGGVGLMLWGLTR